MPLIIRVALLFLFLFFIVFDTINGITNKGITTDIAYCFFWVVILTYLIIRVIFFKGAMFYGLKKLNLPIEYTTNKQVEILEYASIIQLNQNDSKNQLLVNWETEEYQIYFKDRFSKKMNKMDIINFQLTKFNTEHFQLTIGNATSMGNSLTVNFNNVSACSTLEYLIKWLSRKEV